MCAVLHISVALVFIGCFTSYCIEPACFSLVFLLMVATLEHTLFEILVADLVCL